MMVVNSPGSMEEMNPSLMKHAESQLRQIKFNPYLKIFSELMQHQILEIRIKKCSNIILILLIENNCQPRILGTANCHSRT